VVDLGWWDHHAPTLDHLLTLVEIMDAWLNQEEDNVVAIHCRAGRGRTGTAIGALLLRRNLFETSEEALQYFARKRSIKEGGVGVPSQRRYVEYARQVFRKERDLYPVRKFYLQRILMKPVPLVDVSGTEFTPSVTVISMTDPGAPLFASTSYKTYYGTDGVIEVLIGCEVEGDILVRVFHQQNILVTTKPILVFRFQFHTNFINDNVLDFNGPKQLDSPKSGFLKDTRFSEQFVVRCVFTQIKPK
jgi:phosphatidylinositol-3,4,5-trisphosphate 3-phosphatase/dual-specificity protein phosphatase PTEN